MRDNEHHVLIDDVRDFHTDVTLRNYDDAMAYLRDHGSEITHLYMDNDLGEEDSIREGWRILKIALWNFGIRPQQVILVSANPIAVEKMKNYLEFTGYVAENPTSVRFHYDPEQDIHGSYPERYKLKCKENHEEIN